MPDTPSRSADRHARNIRDRSTRRAEFRFGARAEAHEAWHSRQIYARVPSDKLASVVTCVDGREALAGDANEPFLTQIVSKLLTLLIAMKLRVVRFGSASGGSCQPTC